MARSKNVHTKSQVAKFKETARKLQCDEDENHLEQIIEQFGGGSEAQAIAHASDCAVHNAPAYKPGRCDCGVVKSPR